MSRNTYQTWRSEMIAPQTCRYELIDVATLAAWQVPSLALVPPLGGGHIHQNRSKSMQIARNHSESAKNVPKPPKSLRISPNQSKLTEIDQNWCHLELLQGHFH